MNGPVPLTFFQLVAPASATSFGDDGRVVAPAEAVVPFGVEVLEGEDDRVLAGRLDLLDVVEVARDLLRAGGQAVEGEDDVLGRQLALLHHARLLREHHALAQVDRRRASGLSLHSHFSASSPRIASGGSQASAYERVLAAVALGSGRGRRRRAARRTGRYRGCSFQFQSAGSKDSADSVDVDRADFERAAVLRLLRLRLRGPGASARPSAPERSPLAHLFIASSFPPRVFFLCLGRRQREPRMRGSSRSRRASPNMLVA